MSLTTPDFQLPTLQKRAKPKGLKETLPLLTDAIAFEKTKRVAESSLYEFVKQSWHVVEPGVDFSEGWHIHTICDHLEAVTDRRIKNLLINIPPRHALEINTHIPTLDGWKTMVTLNVGDKVFGPDGSPTDVVGKSEVFHDRQLYRVWTDDNEYVDCDGDHLWTVRLDRKYNQYNDYTTEQLWARQQGAFVRKLRSGKVEVRWDRPTNEVRSARLPTFGALQFPHKELPIDPYVLGVWLGDGNSNCATLTSHDDDAPHMIAELEKRGYPVEKKNTKYQYLIKGLRVKLRLAGLLNNKHIPEIYFTASAEQRRELVKGLMDTDGTVGKEGQSQFGQVKAHMTAGFHHLLHTLGIKCAQYSTKAMLYEKHCGTYYGVTFYDTDACTMPRKRVRANNPLKKDIGRYIRVEKLPTTGSVQCIKVAREDGLFIAGKGCIVTHNSKSSIVSVIWPVWSWLKDPTEKFLTASYSGSLSIRDAVKSRRLLESPWFQTRWPEIALNRDQNTKQRYENSDTGYRIAASVGGTTTGEGGSILILDDPHGAQDAQSDTMRNSTIEWLDMVWSSRKNDPRTSCSVTVMQRLHEEDASGHYIKQGGFEHLCLPAEYDGVKRRTCLGEYDPRTEKGELLWPNRFGRPELDTLKNALGTYGASGQLQQQPSPEGGGILKVAHVQLWPADRDLPPFSYILQSYDTAFTERTTGDPTGCIVAGVFNYKNQQCLLVLDVWTEHLGYPDLKQRVMDDWKARYGANKSSSTDKGRRADVILVEAKASGQSLLQDLRQSNIPAIAYNPNKMDKVQRAHLMAPILETNCIYVMESKKNPREPITWAKPMIENWEKFPVVTHDELTDCATQMVIYLKDSGFLDVPHHEDDEEEKYADDSRPRVNPYGQ